MIQNVLFPRALHNNSNELQRPHKRKELLFAVLLEHGLCDVTKGNNASPRSLLNQTSFTMRRSATASDLTGSCIWFFLQAFGPEEVSRNDHQGVAVTRDLSIWLECHAPCDTLCCSGLCCCIVTVNSFAVWFQTEAEANIFPHS